MDTKCILFSVPNKAIKINYTINYDIGSTSLLNTENFGFVRGFIMYS